MTKYTFSVDGIPVVIYPACDTRDGKSNPLFDGEEDAVNVLLLSDAEADFRIECFYKNNSVPREPHAVFAALSCFFLRVKGYPNMSLDIAVGDKITKLVLNKTDRYNFLVNSGKCKNICTKTVDFLDGVSVRCDIFKTPDVCATLLCSDVGCLDAERLKLLFERLKPSGVRSACAFSLGGGIAIATVGDISAYDAVRLVLSRYPFGSPEIPSGITEATVNGTPCKFSLSPHGITFYPEIKYIS